MEWKSTAKFNRAKKTSEIEHEETLMELIKIHLAGEEKVEQIQYKMKEQEDCSKWNQDYK
ncbi:hypothetical protein [Mesobacillus subterraneus]|uniref:hypothetical protein n=1 Tax=Mesobacillus subterraneus TaxID=285983 RepID=UPI0014741022|nr:hypothetical protein [Mesobacillus subterraneus]